MLTLTAPRTTSTLDVARCGLHVDAAGDLADADVAARALDVDAAVDAVAARRRPRRSRRSRPPSVPRAATSADFVRDGERRRARGSGSRQVMPWRPKREPRLKPLRSLRHVDEQLRAPWCCCSSTRASSTSCCDSSSCAVSSTSSVPGSSDRVDLDLAGVEADLELDRACRRRMSSASSILPSSGRSPRGACR